ncbi:hypothetical protein LTR97_010383 [Elasticomyces elasticus]|uniref:PHD-type domain-containing protein n=1 Tax=Elasticomyces elasticus TaxID=574655 RepID=A0AAN7ZWG2_9PEZI|nr:hypothetical protein LTR97_010383 [Elasticomyces elasticus]
MAAIAPRPPALTPARPEFVHSTTETATEPPSKKRKFMKYIAGGPGGGGRWVDAEGLSITDPSVIPPPVRSLQRSRRRPTSRRDISEEGDGEHELDVQEVGGIEGETPVASRTMQTRPRRERTERYAPAASTPRPRYSSAAAAAAASQASDGYKPREERSWEDFHPDLDIDVGLTVFSADEVDGRAPSQGYRPLLLRGTSTFGEDRPLLNSDVEMRDAPADEFEPQSQSLLSTPKRKPGRPPRKPESMLSGLGSPPAPRIMPLPTHNPKERLNLPKPSFREFNHFLQYEDDAKENKVNYVDRTMSHVGYQETDRYELPPKVLVRLSEGQQIEDDAEVSLRLESDGLAEPLQSGLVVGRVEYDMDEQDVAWLDDINEQRRAEGVDAIKPAIFEITITQIEKEYHALEKRIPKPQPRHAQTHRPRSSSQAAVNGDANPPGDEPDSKCSICDDGDCENANAIIFCDGCDLAVHQECYGVPFIPEGQWFCRKCKEIGRGTPTCIFCPNVDGAFKQTNTQRWSHLLCSIWIPEVTVANMTFMEPITDVDKVPKGRWKLNCYICNQKMGACIQCGNKNCYLAFHVTCARRAKLFLKMKTPNQAGLDTSALKAFCDKHVPPEWRRTHDTDHAVMEAKRWYRHAFKDRKWADSQSAALELGAPPLPDGGLTNDTNVPEDTIAVTKRRRTQLVKLSWRLPSGAPVVPAVVFASVDANMTRFTIRKRREFLEKAARYWTLKREARRGAALLKRLQLQLEGFSTMEVTRRNFAGMGAVGGPRLIRRIEFAEMLQHDMGRLTELTAAVKERELLRLKEVEMLRELVDIVYFPIPAMLLPILQRAQKLDEKTRMFTAGFDELALRLRERFYTSVQNFSVDFSAEVSKVLAQYSDHEETADADIEAIHNLLHEVKPGTAEHHALTTEQKAIKTLAKRIVKAVKEPLEDALKKEAELKGREHEDAIRKLDSMGIFASEKNGEADEDIGNGLPGKRRSDSNLSAVAGASPDIVDGGDTEMLDADERTDEAVMLLNIAGKDETVPVPARKHTPTSKSASLASSNHHQHAMKPTEPLSPPISTDSNAVKLSTEAVALDDDVFAQGGVPWYLTPFDPVGTTVHEERYTGREVLRDMTEELSDMDEDTLTELAINGVEDSASVSQGNMNGAMALEGADEDEPIKKQAVKKKAAVRRKGRFTRRVR